VQLVADAFNIFNSQTGYNIQPGVHSAYFGLPLNYWPGRRLQLTARVGF
jgi:hypothetical protein